MKDKINKKIGIIIKKKRRKKNISQEILGKNIGVNKSTVSRYETGEIDIPVSKLEKISEVCCFPLRDYTSDISSEEVIDLFFHLKSKSPKENDLSLQLKNYFYQPEHREEISFLCAAYDFLAYPEISENERDIIGPVIIERVSLNIKDERLKNCLMAYLEEYKKMRPLS